MKKTLRIFTALILCALLSLGAFPLMGTAAAQDSSPVFLMSSITAQSNAHTQQAPGMEQGSSTVTIPTGTMASSNWAGYIDTPASDSLYTSVSGSWTVPDISGSREGSAAAQWIGLGGVSTSDLLQMGTLEYVDNGQIVVEVFVEKLPDAAQSVTAVTAGSTFTASISQASDTVWNLTYTVVSTDGETITDTITQTLDADYAEEIGSSAEWISEDPSNGSGSLYPLADMGTIEYSSALVDTESLSSSENTVEPVALVSNNRIAISPSAVGSDGESFSTTLNSVSVGTGGPSSSSGSISSGSTGSGTSTSGTTGSGSSAIGPTGTDSSAIGSTGSGSTASVPSQGFGPSQSANPGSYAPQGGRSSFGGGMPDSGRGRG
jgi:hypothetical protein